MSFSSLDPDSLEFLTPVPDYFHIKCPICLSLLLPDAPRLVTCCGNHFCQSCIDSLSTIRRRECPLCKESDFVSVPDKNHLRALKSSNVLCIMKQAGCEWKGELGDLVNHLSREGNCAYVKLSCIHKCGGSHLRSQLQLHENTTCPQRPASCEYCQQYQSTWKEVESHKTSVCPQRPIDCPNGCGDQIPHDSCSLHLTTCPLGIVECDFANCGCQWRDRRKLLEEHLESSWQKHMFGNMKLLTDRVEKLAEKVESLEEEISQVKATTSQQSMQLQWSQKELVGQVSKLKATSSQQLRQSQKELEDQVSELEATSSRQLQQSQKELEGRISQVKETTSQQSVQLQQSAISHKALEDKVYDLSFQLQQNTSKFEALNDDISQLKMASAFGLDDDDDSDYDDDDDDYSDTSSWGGFGHEKRPFFVTVTNVSGRRSSWTSESFTSRAFYYGSYPGYKMKLHIDVNGTGVGSGFVSVYAQLYHNKNNYRLAWPFTGRFTVRLKDQVSHVNHIDKVINFSCAGSAANKKPAKKNENDKYGICRFIPHSFLKSPHVVKNNMIFEIPEIQIQKKK